MSWNILMLCVLSGFASLGMFFTAVATGILQVVF